MRAALGRWQEQMAKLRQRMASLTIEPPGQTQYEPKRALFEAHRLASAVGCSDLVPGYCLSSVTRLHVSSTWPPPAAPTTFPTMCQRSPSVRH